MSEEEFLKRAINRICKDYDYNFATELKNIYLKKDKELQQKENIIKEVRKMLYKRDKDDYDTYTANVLCDIQSDFEEILRGEY